jgi:superoxide dismutase, Cu-Zn family
MTKIISFRSAKAVALAASLTCIWTGIGDAAVAKAKVAAGKATTEKAPAEAPPKMAMATMAATGEVKVTGMVHLTQEKEGVRVQANLQGLPPGLHGFHVHEKGNCDSAGMGAGGHFNPTTHKHGMPDSTQHHMGDLGNLTAGDDGIATLNAVFPDLTLNGSHSVSGHALIVHAKADDGGQPTGNAGGRISCGVVGEMK